MEYRFICDKKNKSRYNNVKSQNDKIRNVLGINHENLEEKIFSAVMGNKMDAATLYSNVEFPTLLTPGEVGCALSHLAVYQELLDSDEEYFFIFEDDCFIDERFFNSAFIEDINSFMNLNANTGNILLLQSASYSKSTDYIIDQCHLHKARECYCTHGYVINRLAAEGILGIQNPIKFEIDIFKYYLWLGIANIYVLDKDVVSVNNTDITMSEICTLGCRELSRTRRQLQYKKYINLHKKLPWEKRLRARMLRLEKNILKFF